MTQVHPHTKIVLLAIVSCLVILLDSPIALFVCFLGGLCCQASIPPSWRQIRLLLLFIGLGTWGLIYSQGIFYNQFPRTVILTLIAKDVPVIGGVTGGIHLYREGLFHGAVQSLRFNTMLTVSCFIIWTTQPRDLLLALVKLRVPYSLAFMVTTGLRYIPLIGSEARTVIRSQRLRGFRYLQLNFFQTISGILSSLRPILTNNIRRATHLSEAVESRGFSSDAAHRIPLRELKTGRHDVILIVLLLACLLVVIGLKGVYFLYTNGLYYGSWLRGTYTFVREML